MDWERIESARTTARFVVAIPRLAMASLALLEISRPASTGPDRPGPDVLGIPFSTLTLAVGAFGVLIGFAWMWRIYREPTRYEGAHWRFHDH